jgi:sugar phosphate isomerase/epimerase
MVQLPIALQLYTVRDELAVDYVGTLQKVAEIGYTAVELGRADVLAYTDLQAVLSDLGLRAVAMHISY